MFDKIINFTQNMYINKILIFHFRFHDLNADMIKNIIDDTKLIDLCDI